MDRKVELKIIDEYEKVQSCPKVAKKCGVHADTVRRALKRCGVQLRSPHQSKLTEKEELEIVRKYEEDKLSTIKLAKKYPVSQPVIAKILEKHGIKRRKCGRQKILSEKVELEMARKYEQNNSLLDLAKEYSVSAWTVREALARHGVKIRPAITPRKYELDETVFDEINEESAYWVGVMISDGNIKKDNRIIRLCLKENDIEHIKKFKTFLISTHPIWHRRKKYGIEISSKKLAKGLNKFGVVPRKTLKARMIGLENNRHSWRGVCDGDACISISKTGYIRLESCGSYQLMHQFHKYAKKICPKSKAKVRPLKRIYKLSLNGKSAVAMICHLYKDCKVALDRKLKKAKRIIKKKEHLEALFSSL